MQTERLPLFDIRDALVARLRADARGAFEVLSAEVDRFHRDGRYPSDHFPVTAVLRVSVSDAAKIKPGD